MNEAEKRAVMPPGKNAVLDRRTLENDNRNLLTMVKPGHSVLDVGCGSGTITAGIVDLVGDSGFVKGIDTSEHLITTAKNSFSHIKNLVFETVDINNYKSDGQFDVVTSARVLQWLSNPKTALLKMKDLVKPGGCITILDYNHEKIEFAPAIPKSMQHFYTSFLQWRKDAGMDNQIADHVADIFAGIALENITSEDMSEISIHGQQFFYEQIGIWKKVAEGRGPQLVQDHYITESERLDAIESYQHWMDHEATYMKLNLRAVTAYNLQA